jgi:hypothetical protein
MIKLVTVSLFGAAHAEYAKYLPAFMRGHLNVFPLREGWRLRFYVDSEVAKNAAGKLIRRYAQEGLCESVIMYGLTTATPPLCKAMLWRVDPVFDAKVDYVFCRDLDAPPMPRDRACCESFMASRAAVHTIHDNEQHVGVMGGLCGFWAPEFRKRASLAQLGDLYRFGALPEAEWARKGADQVVLNRVLDERPQLTLLEHRYSGWSNGPGKLPAREPGAYRCEAWSMKTPDLGYWRGGPPDQKTTDAADRLGAHLGCAGYDHEAAVKFWDDKGDPGVAASARASEAL